MSSDANDVPKVIADLNIGALTTIAVAAAVTVGFNLILINTVSTVYSPLLGRALIESPNLWWFLSFSIAAIVTSLVELGLPGPHRSEVLVPLVLVLAALGCLGLYVVQSPNELIPSQLATRLLRRVSRREISVENWWDSRAVQATVAATRSAVGRKETDAIELIAALGSSLNHLCAAIETELERDSNGKFAIKTADKAKEVCTELAMLVGDALRVLNVPPRRIADLAETMWRPAQIAIASGSCAWDQGGSIPRFRDDESFRWSADVGGVFRRMKQLRDRAALLSALVVLIATSEEAMKKAAFGPEFSENSSQIAQATVDAFYAASLHRDVEARSSEVSSARHAASACLPALKSLGLVRTHVDHSAGEFLGLFESVGELQRSGT